MIESILVVSLTFNVVILIVVLKILNVVRITLKKVKTRPIERGAEFDENILVETLNKNLIKALNYGYKKRL